MVRNEIIPEEFRTGGKSSKEKWFLWKIHFDHISTLIIDFSSLFNFNLKKLRRQRKVKEERRLPFLILVDQKIKVRKISGRLRENIYSGDENRFFSKNLIKFLVVKIFSQVDSFSLTISSNFGQEYGGPCGEGMEFFEGSFWLWGKKSKTPNFLIEEDCQQ